MLIRAIQIKFLFIGYYRQWSVPGQPNSNSPANQIQRFEKMIALIGGLTANESVLLASETNIDMHNVSLTAAPHLVKMRKMFVDHSFPVHFLET